MTHWSEGYLGDAWVAHDHDCWAFARRVWRERFALEVPALDFDATSALDCRRALATQPERRNWGAVIDAPLEGDAVLMGKNHRPAHVGIWVAPGSVLHCVEGAGVILQDKLSLKMSGWNLLGFYRRTAP